MTDPVIFWARGKIVREHGHRAGVASSACARHDPRILRVALRKLRQVGSAEMVEDLRVPPGNRLEALKGDRAGQHSIRINDQ